MTNSRYGALGVLNEEGTALAEFITVGLEPEEEARIGPRPTGRGILGRFISDPQPLRVSSLSVHPDSSGFPPNHPPMNSFLGVPIRIRGDVYGNLYLTDKIGWSEFTSDDEALIGALALAAGIAIENARLHQRVHEVAIYEERDRLARDLHDTVIQRLFAIGLSLQSLLTAPSNVGVEERLEKAIADVDETIRQVRTSIFELGSGGLAPVTLRSGVASLLRELSPVVGFEVRPSFDGPVDTAVPESLGANVLAVIREAVTNIGKHARASVATVSLRAVDGECVLEITDNGVGLPPEWERTSGLGLGNLRSRAEKLHGDFDIEKGATGGTMLTWRVPLMS